MRAFFLAGAAALAFAAPAPAQSSTPAVIGSPQHSAQSGQTTPMGGAHVGRSGSANMATGQNSTLTTPMMGSADTMGSRSSTTRPMPSATRSSATSQGGRDIEPPATAAQISREQARQTGQRSARSTRPEDRAYMGGGMILENGRPVGMGAGMAGIPTNAMGGSMGAVQPGPAGRPGSGNNAGTTSTGQ